jgi:hypothetical protein
MVPLQARIYAGSMASAAYADRMGWAAVAAVTAPPLVLAGLGLTHPDDLTRGLGRVVDEPAHNLGAAVPAAWRQSLDPAPRPARRDRWIGRVAAFF